MNDDEKKYKKGFKLIADFVVETFPGMIQERTLQDSFIEGTAASEPRINKNDPFISHVDSLVALSNSADIFGTEDIAKFTNYSKRQTKRHIKSGYFQTWWPLVGNRIASCKHLLEKKKKKQP